MIPNIKTILTPMTTQFSQNYEMNISIMPKNVQKTYSSSKNQIPTTAKSRHLGSNISLSSKGLQHISGPEK